MGESLEAVDTLVADEVIDNARLSAWEGRSHPDVDAVGAKEYAYSAPFSPEGVEALFTSSEDESTDSVALTPVSELDFDETGSGLVDDFAYSESTYRLETRGDFEFNLATGDREGTIAQAIAPEGGYAVTFSEECAREYPSIQHLAPGHPLLKTITHQLLTACDANTRLRKHTESRETDPEKPVVCGWVQDEQLKNLAADGGTIDAIAVDRLEYWFDAFIENRDGL